MDEAVIVGAEIVAGHDGSAELLVRLLHPDGSEHPVLLDEDTGLKLMEACGASSLEGLYGQSWRLIVPTG
jgi:hypothetical protein